jgi:integrase
MNTTKQRVRYRIHLPEAVLAVLRWHIETQLTTPEMEESDLLFPSITGGFRSPSVLNKPFAEVAEAIGLVKRFTQRGLRRTFNDLARAVAIEGVVTRSISGHLTERMQHHYSTVNADEQRSSIARVIDLMAARDERTVEGGAPTGAPPPPSGAPNEKTG